VLWWSVDDDGVSVVVDDFDAARCALRDGQAGLTIIATNRGA